MANADDKRWEELWGEIGQLETSRQALRGLALLPGEGWARARLPLIDGAITERAGEITTLALKTGRGA